MIIWIYALLSVMVVSGISLIGVTTLALNERRLGNALFFLVALSVGALFGDVFIHILPELFSSVAESSNLTLFILLGLLIFFILEKFLHWRHHHHLENCEHDTVHPLGYLNLISDGLHNFIDGIVIGVSYLVSVEIGFATTLAVILHEIPQEIGDFAILRQSGFTSRQALIFNLLSASLAIAGVITAIFLGTRADVFAPIALALAAGGFLYIAGSDLVPELHKTTDLKKSGLQLLAIAVGIIIMFLLTLIE